MENKNLEISNNNNASKMIDTFNKVIYDVNLLMEKVKNSGRIQKIGGQRNFEFRADTQALKADDVENNKNLLQ